MKAFLCLMAMALPLFGQTWEWQNPLPTGYTLEDVVFVDANLGWAVGGPGNILHTTDGGISWSTQQVSPMSRTHAVCFTDALHGWVFGVGPEEFHTSDGGVTWTPQTIGPTIWITDAVFRDENHGWAVGVYDSLTHSPGVILRTTDGGQQWELQETSTAVGLWAVSFPDTVHGWAVGYDSNLGQGVILHTADGGISWSVQYQAGFQNYLRSTSFVDSMNGWVSGGQWSGGYLSTILHTTDGGATWANQSCPENTYVTPIVFSDENTGWAYGYLGSLFHTSDGGATWLEQTYPATQHLASYSALDANRVWGVGESGMIVHTSDGGGNWERLSHGIMPYLNGVAFSDRLHGWAVGGWLENENSAILNTTDGGSTWNLQPGAQRYLWDDVTCLNANCAWAAGSFGVIGRTTDGGASWDTMAVYPDTGALIAIEFVDSLHGWAVGEAYHNGENAPLVFHTTNAGASWTEQFAVGMDYVWDVAFPDSVNGWIVADNGTILHTTDGGELWAEQNAGNNFVPLYSVSFVDPQHGWACGYEFGSWFSVLWRTTDGGETWESLPCGGYRNLTDVVFLDEQNGWMIANIGLDLTSANILRTTDGGGTWTVMDGGGDYYAKNLAVVDEAAVWVVGQGGVIRRFQGPTFAPPGVSRAGLPSAYTLSVYPNPFNPTTTISFDLAQAGRARVAVYDVLGQVVKVLGDQVYGQGTQRIPFNGSALPSGTYFVRLETKDVSKTQRLLLLK